MPKGIRVKKSLTQQITVLDNRLNDIDKQIELLQQEKKEVMTKRDELESKDFELTQEAEAIAKALLDKSEEDAKDLLERIVTILKSGGAPKKLVSPVKELLASRVEEENLKPVEVNKDTLSPIFEEPEPEGSLTVNNNNNGSNWEQLYDKNSLEAKVESLVSSRLVESKEYLEVKLGDLVSSKLEKGTVYKVLEINPVGNTVKLNLIVDANLSLVNRIAEVSMDDFVVPTEMYVLPYNNYENKIFEKDGYYFKIVEDLDDTGVGVGALCEEVTIDGKPTGADRFILHTPDLNKVEEVV